MDSYTGKEIAKDQEYKNYATRNIQKIMKK